MIDEDEVSEVTGVVTDALNDDDMRSFHDYVREWKK